MKATSFGDYGLIVKFSERPKFIPNTKFVRLEGRLPRHSMYQHTKVSRKNIIANSGLQRVCKKIPPTDEVGAMSRPRASSMEVIQHLARTLRDLGFPVNRIANEIVHQLKGRASRSWILEILDDGYKDKAHQESARKRKVAPVAERQEEDLASYVHEAAAVAPVAERDQQITVGVGGHEMTDSGPGDVPIQRASEQDIATIEASAAKESPQQDHAYHLRILIDWDELSDKMAELHYKDIKNFWLCGRIENGKLLDMVLEREVQ